MRKLRQQYHFRKVGKDIFIWDVNELLNISKDLPITYIPIEQLTELNEAYWSMPGNQTLTCKEIADHSKIIFNCDLSFPILLCPEKRIVDGMHRVCKAYLEGHSTIKAQQLLILPQPKYKNIDPKDLPY